MNIKDKGLLGRPLWLIIGLMFLLYNCETDDTSPYEDDTNKIVINPFISNDANGLAFNKLNTKTERDKYIQNKLNEDWVNTIPSSTEPLWVCGSYADQLVVNSINLGKDVLISNIYQGDSILYNGFYGMELQNIYENHGTLANMGKLGLPMGTIVLVDTSHYGSYYGHAMNWIITGDNLKKFEDINCIEPQFDLINVQPGQSLMPWSCDIVEFNYYYVDSNNKLQWLSIVRFRILNGVPTLFWENTDANFKIVTKRGK